MVARLTDKDAIIILCFICIISSVSSTLNQSSPLPCKRTIGVMKMLLCCFQSKCQGGGNSNFLFASKYLWHLDPFNNPSIFRYNGADLIFFRYAYHFTILTLASRNVFCKLSNKIPPRVSVNILKFMWKPRSSNNVGLYILCDYDFIKNRKKRCYIASYPTYLWWTLIFLSLFATFFINGNTNSANS